MVKKGALCKNCLKPGHIASKRSTRPMGKKCNKYQHTLLHIEAEPKAKGTKQVTKDFSYAVPSKPSEEVPLMTCRFKITSPDSIVTLARTLLDSVASTLLISELLGRKLCLFWCHRVQNKLSSWF